VIPFATFGIVSNHTTITSLKVVTQGRPPNYHPFIHSISIGDRKITMVPAYISYLPHLHPTIQFY